MHRTRPPEPCIQPHRLLARELRISAITTNRSYEDLERDGFIETVVGKGSFVAGGNLELVREERLRTIESHLQSAVDGAFERGRTRRTQGDVGCALWRGCVVEPGLMIVNLTKRYDDFVLDDASFELPAGGIMGFVGENGPGKSTTIKLILNLIAREAGTIEVLSMENIA